MRKKWCMIFGLLFVVIGTLTFIKVEYFPFGFEPKENKPNTTILRYKITQQFDSKDEVTSFLIHQLRTPIDELKIREEHYFWKRVYTFVYTQKGCNLQFIKVTHDGYVINYSSCGK